MSKWISSKLKVAETFFEQIDQQAAESLKKNERPRSKDERFEVSVKSGGAVPLKDQLKKKTQGTNFNNEHQGKLFADPIIDSVGSNIFNVISSNSNDINEEETTNAPKPSPKPKPTLTDRDWTELLNQPTISSNRNNGVTAIHGLRKDFRKQGDLGLNLDGKKNQKGGNISGGVKSKKRLDNTLGNKLNGKSGDGEESSSSARSSSVEIQNDGKILDRPDLDHKDSGVNLIGQRKNKENEENDGNFESRDIYEEDLLQVGNNNSSLEVLSVPEKVDTVSDVKKEVGKVYDRLRGTVRGKHGSDAASRSSVSDDLRRGTSSTSEGGSDSDGDSDSSSDSENERDRERRKKILAEKAAAKALEAIKERENAVARLEGEKQSLEKILEERAKQQAQEASELQITMMETMEAVELEKQKHNNTRMEALGRMAKLETANANLARSLATAQKNLEMEIDQVADLREQYDRKEVAIEELKRRISHTHQTGTYLNQVMASKGVEFEREILEAEYSFLNDKIGRLEDKAKKLEENIEMTRKEMEDPTEVEIELKRRLGQLTDHLIQKQAQVEALSSEKATIMFRIEAVSRLMDENKSMVNSSNLESGASEFHDLKLRPLFEDKIRSGRKHLGSMLQQLDAIFMAGAVFLRRNPVAKIWSVVYLVCLHFWVIYIFMSHSHPSNEGRSGAVFSLENINNTNNSGS